MNQDLFKDLGRVYEHFHNKSFPVFIKACDFYVPWFFGRKAKQLVFLDEFRPFSVATFIEALRNNTSKINGTPNEELMNAFCDRLLNSKSRPLYNIYWDFICSEIEKNPEEVKPIVSGLTTLFMGRIFGPRGLEEDPKKLTSHMTQIAVDFQVGTLMFEYFSGTKSVLTRYLKKGIRK